MALTPPTLAILGSSITALAVLREAASMGWRAEVLDTHKGPAFWSRHGHKVLSKGLDCNHLLEQNGPEDTQPGMRWVVATSDDWLRALMRARTALEAAGWCVLHPDNASLDICLDKQLFARHCQTHDLPTPLTWFPDEAPRPAQLHPPVILRPVQTQHASASTASALPKALELRDEATLQTWLTKCASQRTPCVISKSLLRRPGLQQLSVPFARGDDGQVTYTAMKVRPLPRQCAVGSCVTTWHNPSAQAVAERAIASLQGRAIGEVEILHDPDTGDHFVIEINARPWMQYGVAAHLGHQFLAVAAGLPRKPNTVRHGQVTWVFLINDLFQAFSRSVGVVRSGEVSLLGYLRSLSHAKVFAYFAWTDPVPAIHKSLSLVMNRLRSSVVDPKTPVIRPGPLEE